MKRTKIAVLYLMKMLGLFAVVRYLSRQNLCILCYHGAWRGRDGFPGDSMFIKPDTFAARLKLLQRRSFSVLTLDQAVVGLSGAAELPPCSVAITIDDGWYSTYADMLPTLKRHGMPATIYCDSENLVSGLPIPHVMARYLRRIHAGGPLSPEAEAAFERATDLKLDREDRYAAALEFARHLRIDIEPYLADRVFAYMTPGELADAHSDGFAIELHTHQHSLHDFSVCKIWGEVALNRDVLAALLGRSVASFRHFCYPSGQTAPGVGAVLRDLGIVSATTLEPGMAGRDADPLLLPRILDGGHLSTIEFEAELCGVSDLLRRIRRILRSAPGQISEGSQASEKHDDEGRL
jgi:peptidoglycan/xylan/chitin deacetylase (PgdA/CDA1 family)